MIRKLFLATVVALAVTNVAVAQRTAAGDRDDQFVLTGCVMPSADFRSAPSHTLFVWSRGDVYLASPDVRLKPSEAARPIGTAGTPRPVFYWLNDEDDFAKYAGQRVEIVGELSDELDDGAIEIKHEGNFTKIEFDAGGREATARVPTTWLGPFTRGKDLDFDITVRTVDVEKVTVMGPCTSR